MNFNEFEELLEKANLKKSEFANLVEMNTNSVSNWSSSNKIPPWVKSWLENYIKAKDMDKVVEAVKPHIKNIIKDER